MSYGIKFKWYSTACNEIDLGGKTWVTDPFIDSSSGAEGASWKDIKACDYITISHMHYDHIPEVPQLQRAHKANVLLADLEVKEFATWSDIAPNYLYPMSVGNKINFGDVKFEAIYGHHTALARNYSDLLFSSAMNSYIDDHCGGDAGLKGLNTWGCISYRNWLATLPNGTKILVWGGFPKDEDIFMVKDIHPDILFFQCTVPEKYAEKTAKLVLESDAKIAIPQHMDFPADGEEKNWRVVNAVKDMVDALGKDIKCILPKKGEWIEL